MKKETKAETGKTASKGGKTYTAGAGTGLGRLQKIKAYGAKQK